MNLQAYRFVIRIRGARIMILGTTLARVAYSIIVVSLLALGESRSDSFLFAGGLVTLMTIVMGLFAIPKGRYLDRHGPTLLLLGEGFLSASALLLALAIIIIDLPNEFLLLLALLIGIGDPSTVAVAKNAWWRKTNNDQERLSAMALELTLSGMSYSLGALLAGGAVLFLGPERALLLAILLMTISPLALTTNSMMKGWVLNKSRPEALRTLFSKLGTLLMVYIGFFAISGSLPVLLLAASDPKANLLEASFLPLLLAAIYPGTMLSGLIYGSVVDRHPAKTLSWTLLLGSLLLAILFFSSSVTIIFGIALLLFGFSRGPIPATVSYLSLERLGSERGGQASGALSIAISFGLAFGALAAGWAIEFLGTRWGLLLPAALGFISLGASLFNYCRKAQRQSN